MVAQLKSTDSGWQNLLAEIKVLLPEDRFQLWSLDRSYNSASIFYIRNDAGKLTGALLEAGRQKTNYRKIVDFIAIDSLMLGELITAVIENAKLNGCIVLKCEEHKVLHEYSHEEKAELIKFGFAPEPVPVHSHPSTHGDVFGWSNWFDHRPSQNIKYFGQTTDVTCGAGTALMALESHGGSQLEDDNYDLNREIEIDLWRSATNMPACEPVGLAVATFERTKALGLELGKPSVHLSTESTSLLEWFKEFDYTLREQLQFESFRKASALGINVARDWISTDSIISNIQSGNLVFLLIDLTVMINDPTPHWVLAHDVIDSCVVISDPWIETKAGETWVDCSNLPVSIAAIDEMTRWGEPAYRGVVIVPTK